MASCATRRLVMTVRSTMRRTSCPKAALAKSAGENAPRPVARTFCPASSSVKRRQNVTLPTADSMSALRRAHPALRSACILRAVGRRTSCPASSFAVQSCHAELGIGHRLDFRTQKIQRYRERGRSERRKAADDGRSSTEASNRLERTFIRQNQTLSLLG